MILATFVLYLADQENQTDDARGMLNDFKVTRSADNMILLLFYILFVNILLYIATVREIFNHVFLGF